MLRPFGVVPQLGERNKQAENLAFWGGETREFCLAGMGGAVSLSHENGLLTGPCDTSKT